jgi:hypothetical protein
MPDPAGHWIEGARFDAVRACTASAGHWASCVLGKLSGRLAGPERNLFVVGDDDQP